MVDESDRLWVDSMAQAYETWLAPAVFRPFAVDLAARAAARPARDVLELAAGTGVLTAELVDALPEGAVVATDLNAAMVELGRQRVPAATWRQADAMRLPFDPVSFDLVACQFGVMFFPDKRDAFAEAHRVLAPGGRLVFSAWAALELHDFEAALVAALARVFPVDPPTFMAAVPHGYANPDVAADDVRASGFRDVTVDTVTLQGRAASAADIAAGYCGGTPIRAALEARGDVAEATEAVARELEAELGPGPVTGRMTAYVLHATADG